MTPSPPSPVRERKRFSLPKLDDTIRYRLLCLFLLSGFLGYLIEVVFWRFTRGEWVSRSSFLYGPFSLVWALGALLLTLVLFPRSRGSNLRLFLLGAAVGGVFEYVCSWVQEAAFGAIFWDYRHLPFNLGGRINLVFCLFWGALALLWVRALCPGLCRLIDRFPLQRGRRVVRVVSLLLLCSALLSAAALGRMDLRREGVPASSPVEQFLDRHYPDSYLQARYPYMKLME